jgi:tripartite-type tricarboxylate transporter receptor subunit TctC
VAAGVMLAATALGFSPPAAAQDYPNRLIKIIVPYGPGGPSDVIARLFAKYLQESTKQSVVVENRAGAGSTLGARAVAVAEPDGYTLLMGNTSTWAVAPSVVKNPGYDPLKSFAPIANVAEGSTILIAHPSLPAKNMQELVAYARANPGKVALASTGVGNAAHIVSEALKARAGVDIVHVPYKSGVEMTTAVLGGQAQITFVETSTGLSLVQDGKVRAIAVGNERRAPELPDVPTMVESGYPGFINRNWTALVAPAGTPPAIVAKLNGIVTDFNKSPETIAALAKFGIRGEPNSPQDLAALMEGEVKHWASLLKEANFKPE